MQTRDAEVCIRRKYAGSVQHVAHYCELLARTSSYLARRYRTNNWGLWLQATLYPKNISSTITWKMLDGKDGIYGSPGYACSIYFFISSFCKRRSRSLITSFLNSDFAFNQPGFSRCTINLRFDAEMPCRLVSNASGFSPKTKPKWIGNHFIRRILVRRNSFK